MKQVEAMFDKNTVLWTDNRETNVWLIENVKACLNRRLEYSSWVSLNDALDELGIPRTKMGQVTVWKNQVIFELIPVGEHDVKIIFKGLVSLF